MNSVKANSGALIVAEQTLSDPWRRRRTGRFSCVLKHSQSAGYTLPAASGDPPISDSCSFWRRLFSAINRGLPWREFIQSKAFSRFTRWITFGSVTSTSAYPQGVPEQS
jgi:hypothetical protein